ncbi:MAG: ATP-binding protein [Tolypothrix brevis GSE-NOS-MK-07-07A]|jgi:anti-sigma regulatory factor (Ser/Thr protein kinase)|nr:ATP-binding protein [Tolypothrix brevis GSE-NOS-MK-07-07A]
MEPLIVSGTLNSLSAIAQYVKAAACAAGLDEKASYRLRHAVDEIATNIIFHGYKTPGSEGLLHLQADIDQKTLTISIQDTGVAYDPYQTPTPDEKELHLPLEQRQLGGLGVYLAIQGVDKFMYNRVGNGNQNIFVVYRPVS